jgi:dTDP-4-amino-4,6-dideoxy-D-galactose acyltransferase
MKTSDSRGNLCTLLEWDSQFWGIPIGHVNSSRLTEESLAGIITWCVEHRIQCLYFSADGSDRLTLSLAAEGGFQFVDMRIELEKRCNDRLTPMHRLHNIRHATMDDLQMLKNIAGQSFEDTRFFKDRHFDQAHSRMLYERWIENDLSHNHILICTRPEDDVDVIGFLSCSVNVKLGRIGLVAIHPTARGTGVAQCLLHASEGFLGMRGAESIVVATQASNVAAMRLYESYGFKTRETRVWFHRWAHV